MRILIIEDDEKLAKLMGRVLEKEHHAIELAHDGDIGLEFALQGAYDAAIVDWMLPRRDGPSIVRAMRAAKIRIPVLMLTARTQVEDRVTGLDSGADDYLVKPFSFDELLARVRAMGRRTAADAVGDELRCGEIVMDLR
ncbi:MAG: response regulator, partial [Anaerolineae bacterium]